MPTRRARVMDTSDATATRSQAKISQLMRKIFQSSGGGQETWLGRWARWCAAGVSRIADYRFGGKFWVVVDNDGDYEFRNVTTGITDLDQGRDYRGTRGDGLGTDFAKHAPRGNAARVAELDQPSRRRRARNTELIVQYVDL